MDNPAKLPDRYQVRWQDFFFEYINPNLVDDINILDAGSGRCPIITPDDRPEGCHYFGIDITEDELKRAPPGSYNEYQVGDITEYFPALEGRFDLVVSFFLLEHVKSTSNAINNIRSYLKDDGVFIALLAGKFALFSALNVILPNSVGVFAMKKLLGRDPGTVFPAHYDHCYFSALDKKFSDWSESRVVPIYRGANYFAFSKVAQSSYVYLENILHDKNIKNLATHYLLVAKK